VRRLVLALTVLALTVVVGAAGAGAAKSGPHLTVNGAAHAAAGKLQGAFTVENTGTGKAPPLTATVKLVGSGKKPAKLTVQRTSIPALAAGAKQRVKVKATVPGKADSGTWSIVACAGSCVKIGKLTGGSSRKKATAPNAPSPPAPTTPAPAAPAPAPLCPTPSAPISYTVDVPTRHTGCGVEYWVLVPDSYSAATAAPLLIWLHGCGGESEGDAYTVSPSVQEKPQDWISLTLIGREEPGNECWVPSLDETKVLQALTDVETHLNINTHRVILGGYSSGGDLSYRTGFHHSSTFAGLLIENSAPFRDTESTQAESLGAATTKFPIVHLAHDNEEEVYPRAQVESEVNAVKAAGFPITLIVRPGEHYDAHTDPDMQEVLLPYIDNGGWTSP
jgi:predicted esterase